MGSSYKVKCLKKLRVSGGHQKRLDMQRHCVIKAVFAPSLAAVEAADAGGTVAAAPTTAAAAAAILAAGSHGHVDAPTPTPVGAGAAADAAATAAAPTTAAADAYKPAAAYASAMHMNCEAVPTTASATSVVLPAIVEDYPTSSIETNGQIAPSFISDQPLLC